MCPEADIVPSYLRFTCRLLQKAAIFAALVTGGALAGAAVASDVPECEQACFVLTGVQLQGVSAFPASELAYTYEDYLTRPVAVEDLVKVAASITDHYRAEGYFLTRAAVAPHDGVSGLATIVVYEGYIDEVIVEGSDPSTIRALVGPLGRRDPTTIAELDRRLTLAADLPGYSLESRIEPVLGDPAGHRLVVTPEFERYSAYARVTNRGSDTQGPWQVYVSAAANSIIADGDQMTLAASTTPQNPDELTSAKWGYSLPLSDGRRLEAGVSGYTTNAKPSSTNGRLSGQSVEVWMNLAQPLIRKRKQSLWLNTSLDVREKQQTYAQSGRADETLAVARASLFAWQRFADGYLSSSLEVSQGLEAFGATVGNAPNLSRSNADGIFTKLNARVSGYTDVWRFLGIYAEVSGQWSNDPLLSSEEFSVGGPTYGRAYNYGEVSGDMGAAAAIELRAGWDPDFAPVSFFQTYAFYDAASVSNYTRTGTRSNELSSAGVGVRVTFKDRTTFRAELAKPLDWVPYTETDNDWRVFVTLSRQF